MVEKRETLGDMLLHEGVINHDQLEEAFKRQKILMEKSIGQILVEMGVITESVKMHFLQKKFGYDLYRFQQKQLDPTLLAYIPRSYARKYHVVPVGLEKGVLVIAMDDPSDLTLLDNIKTTVGIPIKTVIASTADIDEAIEQYPEPAEDEYTGLPKVHSGLYKFFKYISFPVLGFLPLLIFIILLNFSERFFDFITNITKAGTSFSFDVFLYTLLGWGLWIIIMWEINGLIFEEETPKKPYPPPEEPEE